MQPRHPIHPGEILLREFLEPHGLSQTAFAAHIKVSTQRLNEIVKGRRGISPETALLLAVALGTTPQFWLNLQNSWDLAHARQPRGIRPIARPRAA